jgi:hypothetical protein
MAAVIGPAITGGQACLGGVFFCCQGVGGALAGLLSTAGACVPATIGFCGNLGVAFGGLLALSATLSLAVGSWALAAVFGTMTVVTVCSAGCRSVPDDASEEDIEKAAEQKRRCRYLTLQWTLQILSTLFCLLFTVWASIQATALLVVIGVSTEPPGLRVKPFEDRM